MEKKQVQENITFRRYKIKDTQKESFYRTPKILYNNHPGYRFEGMNPLAKQLYSLLLDRHDLSVKNGWVNPKGEVYIIYTRKDMQRIMEVSKNTIINLIDNLKTFRLLEEERPGLGKSNKLYLLLSESHKISRGSDLGTQEVQNRELKSSQIRNSGGPSEGPQGVAHSPDDKPSQAASERSQSTDFNDTDFSNTEGEGAEPPKDPPAEKEAEKNSQEKKPRGEYNNVLLTDDELTSLISSYGKAAAYEYIRRVDVYVETRGLTYSIDHYDLIKEWLEDTNISNTKGKEADPPKDPPAEKEAEKNSQEKKNHGEYNNVILTDAELSSLVSSYGKAVIDEYIRRVDVYTETKGAAYSNHYALIKKWITEDKEKQEKERPPGASSLESLENNNVEHVKNTNIPNEDEDGGG